MSLNIKPNAISLNRERFHNFENVINPFSDDGDFFEREIKNETVLEEEDQGAETERSEAIPDTNRQMIEYAERANQNDL